MSPKPVRLTIDSAWELWRDQQDGEAKDWLIIHYSSLVKFVAGRLAAGLPRTVETNDLVSAGVFGLMDAVARFSPEVGVKFETFAVPRIRGAILDSLRALDWVPRTVRSNTRAIEDAISTLEHKLHRAPTEDEIAEQLGITLEELEKQLSEAAAGNVGPLDHVVLASDEGAPHKAIEEDELREAMRKLAQTGVAVILVTHHLPDIIPEIDRVICLRNGKIFDDGPKREMLTAERLSELFGMAVAVEERNGFYHMW